MKPKKFFFLFLFLGIFLGIVFTNSYSQFQSFESRRNSVIFDLNSAIEKAEKQGHYKCCIEPACTMCYLGNWIWKDGSCYCDDMIAKNQIDKVCPQCIKGIEQGNCKSTLETCKI